MEALELTGNYPSALVSLFEAVRAASCPLPLTSLVFQNASMEDEQLEVLLSAIEMGRLPRLKRLLLEANYITDRGLVALSQTVKGGHLSNLTQIAISVRSISARYMQNPTEYKEGAVSLAAALSSHCPKLVNLKLGGVNYDIKSEIYAIFSEGRKGVRAYLFT